MQRNCKEVCHQHMCVHKSTTPDHKLSDAASSAWVTVQWEGSIKARSATPSCQRSGGRPGGREAGGKLAEIK
eukprot:81659-Pyramimonas_sp.AAC.1